MNVPVAEVAAPTMASEAQAAQDVAMDVDPQAQRSESSGKRKAEDELVREDTKKVHVGKFAEGRSTLSISYISDRGKPCSTQEVSLFFYPDNSDLPSFFVKGSRELHCLRCRHTHSNK